VSIKELSPEVLIAEGPLVNVGAETISLLVERAKMAPRLRVRLCAHPDDQDPLHEMIIVMAEGTYIRPHRHTNKSESMHIIHGFADIVRFSEEGDIDQIIQLGSFESGQTFFQRVSDSRYHTLMLRSAYVVVHETTNGPFQAGQAQFAPWSPDENDSSKEDFINRLKLRCDEFKAGKL
jgi:cupin fold WbuC family metalloprotein